MSSRTHARTHARMHAQVLYRVPVDGSSDNKRPVCRDVFLAQYPISAATLKRIVLKKRFGAELYDKAAPELHAGILAWHTTLHTNNHDHRRHHHRPETTHTPHTPHIIPSTTHHRSLHRSVASQELSRHRVVAIIRQDGACRYTYLG